jgi:NTP pyrophosphatase (non-canonical NTP hydrolase)
MRGQQRVGEVLDLWAENEKLTLAQLFDATVDVLSQVILCWSNMGGIEYSAEALRDVLTFQEARELLRKVMYNQHVTPEEKKSLEPQH